MERARKLKGTDVVEADVRKVLGGLEAHRLFPDDPTARLRGTLVRRVPGKRAWHVAWKIPETLSSDPRIVSTECVDEVVSVR